MKKSLQICFLLLLSIQTNYAQVDFWRLNGSPYGKAIRCITTNGNGHVYISVDDASLFRTTSNGDSWILTDYSSSQIQSMAVDHFGYIYAGTSEEGIFRSNDDGETWQHISDGLSNLNILSITATISGIAYCGTDGGGVYKITIDDTTWSYVGLANVPILSLLVDNVGYIYAGTSGYGIYRSTDGGNEWTLRYLGLGDDCIVNSIVKDSSGTIFIGTERGIYRTSNGGYEWCQSNNGLVDTVVSALALSPSQVILASAGQHLYLSSNGGMSWQFSDPFGAEPLCFAVSKSGFIFTGTFLGLFRSEDNASSWTRVNSGLINGETIHSITFNSTGDLFTAISSGVYRSSDEGVNWRCSNLHNERVFSLLTTPLNNYLFAGVETGITYSTDGGDTWSEKAGFYYAQKVALDIDPLGTLYAGYGSQGWWSNYGAVLKSTDYGVSWNPTALDGKFITAMNVNPAGDIMVARADSGIFLSTDQGETWQAKGLGDKIISSVFLSEARMMIAGTDSGDVFRSIDNGIIWQEIGIPLMRSVLCIISVEEGRIFVGDSAGVFRSTDNGDTWIHLMAGLTDSSIFSLAISSVGYLYAGSSNGFIYKSNQIVTEISDYQNANPISQLLQNYPNPFNPSTSIRFFISEKCQVQLSIFNILGQKVETLINKSMEKGEHLINFESGTLPSGVYIFKLKAGNYNDSKKMLLIR